MGSGGEKQAIMDIAEKQFRSFCQETIKIVLNFSQDEGFNLDKTVPLSKKSIESFLNTMLHQLRKLYPSTSRYRDHESAMELINQLEKRLQSHQDGYIRDAELGVLDDKKIYENRVLYFIKKNRLIISIIFAIVSIVAGITFTS